jgi:hypothetical protein
VVQHLVGHPVANAGCERLVQEEGLDRAFGMSGEQGEEGGKGGRVDERIEAKLVEWWMRGGWLRNKADARETAR